VGIFKLPDLGEGLPDAQIREWHVKVGDFVKVDQPLVSMETAKAVVEVPSPFTGKIKKLFGKTDDTIKVGEVLVEFESDKSEKKVIEDDSTVVGKLETSDHLLEESATGIQLNKKTTAIKAMPAARALAKEFNIDLTSLIPKHENGIITVEDIKNELQLTSKKSSVQPMSTDKLTKLTQIQRALSQKMSESHQKVMPITLMQDADIFTWEKDENITTRLIRAIEKAVKAEPMLNAYYFDEHDAYQLNEEINLGLAVDTKAGLYLPVIKNLPKYSDKELRKIINELKEKAKAQSFSPDDLKGATIILSNYGAISGTYGTPVIVPPMVAIVGIGKAYDKVVINNGKTESHKVLPISISIDHRLVTGGQVARFLRTLVDELEKK